MPKPRYEPTSYNVDHHPVLDAVPYVPRVPPKPFCIKQSVQEYRDKVKPDWWEKLEHQDAKAQKAQHGRDVNADKSTSGGLAGPSQSKSARAPCCPGARSERSVRCRPCVHRRPAVYFCPDVSLHSIVPRSVRIEPAFKYRDRECYYQRYARDKGICQSFVPLLHTMRNCESLKRPRVLQRGRLR
ncbi:uncharacterized protein LOC135399690 isoform X1 [Ornithodoros turicata]|uniref:uncharacterized protein LOC135399690 isoform X1 n=1 Tax=Ornithodoros turicata TaxID=34597 RepID=UPI00313A3012